MVEDVTPSTYASKPWNFSSQVVGFIVVLLRYEGRPPTLQQCIGQEKFVSANIKGKVTKYNGRVSEEDGWGLGWVSWRSRGPRLGTKREGRRTKTERFSFLNGQGPPYNSRHPHPSSNSLFVFKRNGPTPFPFSTSKNIHFWKQGVVIQQRKEEEGGQK